MTPELNPSPALKRAVSAESRRIERACAQLHRRRAQLEAEIRDIDAGLAELKTRERALLDLVPPESLDSATAESATTGASNGNVMRGAQLREHAARVLAQDAGVGVPIHYREWFAKVLDGGVAVGGKEPLGAFLTNVSRSPVVSRGEAAGTYYIDPERLDALRSEIAEKAAELRDLAAVMGREAVAPGHLREHQVRLAGDLTRLERLLVEGERVLRVVEREQADHATARHAA